jgi:hypothetical protein
LAEKDGKIDRKLIFTNAEGTQIGEGFIDAKLLKKNDVMT